MSSGRIPAYPKTDKEKISDVYIRQMRQAAPGYLALWDPTPWRDRDFDEIRIGDVGIVLEGQFRRLFNITVEGVDLINGGQIPDNFVPIAFDPEHDTETTHKSAAISTRIACFGDRLTCEALAKQERDDENSLRYKITKHDKNTSYVLFAPDDTIVEMTLKESKLDAWKEYAERHIQNWVNLAENLFAMKMKPEELILVRGYVKTTRWVIVALHKRSTYELYIGLSSDIHATLTCIAMDVHEEIRPSDVRCGFDVYGPRADRIRNAIRSIDRPLPDSFRDGDPCTRCVFVKGLKVENNFWAQRRVVAA